MDQLIYASLSHTHYWYEVGMLKVPFPSPYHAVLLCCTKYVVGPFALLSLFASVVCSSLSTTNSSTGGMSSIADLQFSAYYYYFCSIFLDITIYF